MTESAVPSGRVIALRAASLGLCLFCVLPIAGWLFPGDGTSSILAREAVFWFMAAAIVVYTLAVERNGLGSLGLRVPTLSSAGYGLLGAVVSFAGMACIYLAVLPHVDPSYASKVTTVQALPFALKLEIVVRAAVFEELFYRGFMIERLSPILGSRSAAAAVSWIAFTAAHVGYWGWGSILLAGFGGAVLTGLYLWRRDLAANMIAHALTDVVSLLI